MGPQRFHSSLRPPAILVRIFAIGIVTIIVIRHRASSSSCEMRGDFAGSRTQWTVEAMTLGATFPLVMVPQSEKKGMGGHIDLMENQDGRFDESKCETWSATTRSAFYCDIEWDEWMIANAFVQPGDVVVEFGARFGKSLLVIAVPIPTGFPQRFENLLWC